MIYVVTGPSGSGKSTLIRRVLAMLKGVSFSVSHTTRPRRKGEREGRDYHFVSPEAFRDMIRRRRFLEWAVVHGAYYGTAKSELTKARRDDLILDIDVQGANQVRGKIPGAVFIFVLPPSFEELRRRIETRHQDSPEAVERRLAAAREEIKSYRRFDYLIINDALDDAVADLASIVRSGRLKLAARRADVQPILRSFRRGGEHT